MRLIFLTSLLYFCVSNGASITEQKQEEFDSITKYQLIHLNLDTFESNNIITFDAYNQHYEIQLTRNNDIAPVINHHTEENGVIQHEPTSCHYHGKVVNDAGKSVVALSLCDKYGVRGMIRAFGDELWIYPADYYLDIQNTKKTFQFTDEHLVYKLSDYKMDENQPSNFITQMKQTITKKQETAANESNRRRLAFNGGNNVVEIYVLADVSFVEHFKGETDDWYSLLYYTLSTIINGASAEYVAAEWDSVQVSGGQAIGKVSLAWVALDVVETYNSQLFAGMGACASSCTHGGSTGTWAYVKTFGEWCQNNKDIGDFDYGVVYSAGTYGGGGMSHVGGMCVADRKYGYVGSTSMSKGSWLLFAHELGHDLGMQHDESSGADAPYTCAGGIMYGPSVQDNGFTTCSLKYLRDYFNENGVACLSSRSNTFTSNYDQTPVDPFSCVLISDSSNNADKNGQWTQPTNGMYNEQRYYTKVISGQTYYLYYGYNSGSDYYMWSISTSLGEWSWNNVVCNWTPASIHNDCDGKWNNDGNAKFGYCPRSTSGTTSTTTTTTTTTTTSTATPTTTTTTSTTASSTASSTASTTASTTSTTKATTTTTTAKPASGDCITVSGFTRSTHTKYNGQWFEASTSNGDQYDTWNGYPYYILDNTHYLYMNGYIYNGNTYYFWVISTTLGQYTWNQGYCRGNDRDILNCGQWSADSNAIFESCSAFTSLAESHPCLVPNAYDDNLCFYQNSSMISAEPFMFEVTEAVSCIGDYGVYRYISSNDQTNKTYYLHHTNDKWTISIDYITQYGEYFCEESDLMDCENGKWKMELVDEDSARIITNNDVMISSCPSSSEENVESDADGISVIAIIVIVLLCVVAIGVCAFFFIRSKKSKGVQSFQTDDTPQRVGVSMDATNMGQAENAQEIEVEVQQTHTIE